MHVALAHKSTQVVFHHLTAPKLLIICIKIRPCPYWSQHKGHAHTVKRDNDVAGSCVRRAQAYPLVLSDEDTGNKGESLRPRKFSSKLAILNQFAKL